jgi:protein-tyrosine-phosphatase/peptidoglycan/xylan/chitin deacetylase (PgdA/CDA1 family)
MTVPNCTLKSILTKVASTSMVIKFLSRHSEGLATVFLLHRAAGVYAGINGHAPHELEQMLIELKRRKIKLVSLQQVVDAAWGRGDLPSGSIAFTVDDGYRDQIEVIAPIFVKHQVPLTIFLITGLINGELWPWDAKIHWLILKASQTSLEIKLGRHCLKWPLVSQLERMNTRRELQAICASFSGEEIDDFICSLQAAVGVELPHIPPVEFAPANWEQVRQLESAGVRFAPHTHTHRILSRLQEAEVRSELGRSLEIIMAETHHGLPIFAYPVGMEQHFRFREMHLAENMGFSAAFVVCNDYNRWGDAQVATELRFRLARFGLPKTITETLWLTKGLQSISEKFYDFNSVKLVGGIYINKLMARMTRPLIIKHKDIMKRLAWRLFFALGRYDSLKNLRAERIGRFVFVCRGNICRSPYAEAAAKSHGISAISCGVDVRRSVPAESVAVRAAFLSGKNLTAHMSRSISEIPFNSSDCFVVMDPSNLPIARVVADSVGCQITLIGLWRKSAQPEIMDPYNSPMQVYRQCFHEIDESLTGLATLIGRTL